MSVRPYVRVSVCNAMPTPPFVECVSRISYQNLQVKGNSPNGFKFVRVGVFFTLSPARKRSLPENLGWTAKEARLNSVSRVSREKDYEGGKS